MQLAAALSAIFQKLTDSGDLPENQVNANVSPVFKAIYLSKALICMNFFLSNKKAFLPRRRIDLLKKGDVHLAKTL